MKDNENILSTLRLAQQMISLADMGDAARKDRACGVIYAILRDTAYKLRTLCKEEIESHKRKGCWDIDEETTRQRYS